MIAISVIAIYSRKSKFTGKGASIENQIELCKEYAEKYFEVANFLLFEDEGYSGGNTNRPMYKKMLEEALNNRFDVLICYRLDRISRNISDFSHLVELLRENSIDFISIRENFDTSTPMGRAMMYIASVFAQLERETISERIRDNMYSLAKTGRWLGGKTPTGFRSEQVEYYDKENNRRKIYKLTPVQHDLELVKSLYDKYLNLGSLSNLESWTLENNLKTRNNKPFDKSILKIILSNPVYAVADKSIYDYFFNLDSEIPNNRDEFDGTQGLMVYNKHDEKKNKTTKKDESEWIVAIGLHQGIISSDDWIKVQGLLSENRKKAPRIGTGRTGLITNFLRCKCCGSKMRITVSRRNSGTYYYYKCIKKEQSRGTMCNINNLNGKKADKLVLNEVEGISFKKSEVFKHLNELSKNFNFISNNELNKSKLEKEMMHFQDLINNLTLQLAQNQNTSAAKHIIRQIEKFDKEISKLEVQIESLNQKKKIGMGYQRDLEIILNLINEFNNNISELDFQEKKRILSMLIDEILWDGNTLTILFKGT